MWPYDLSSQLITQDFVTVGEATFSVLFWDIYKSKLLTTSGNYPVEVTQDNLLFDINYLTDIASKDLINNTIEQWQHLGIAAEVYQAYLPQLKTLWPDIKEGDSLSLLIHQGRSIFYFNKQYIGVINEPEFGQVFLAIWLSKNTSQPKLRNKLLGSTNEK
ncbi:hypothetical protein FCS21_13495 [Colwellia ponticola]|uniref:Chalcone isomerase domain-containing protein n=2 Tax=Colwellia ponticola TaxID=2304625 RepID=A0A8H2PJU0_9GAMM|nr:hypothetical protein FCS21_13495 [Colwellia ponticola]